MVWLAKRSRGHDTAHQTGRENCQAKLKGKMTQKLTIQQVQANRRERGLVARARDVKILLQWFEHDVMTLAGPALAVRQELYDFIVSELKQRAGKSYPSYP